MKTFQYHTVCYEFIISLQNFLFELSITTSSSISSICEMIKLLQCRCQNVSYGIQNETVKRLIATFAVRRMQWECVRMCVTISSRQSLVIDIHSYLSLNHLTVQDSLNRVYVNYQSDFYTCSCKLLELCNCSVFVYVLFLNEISYLFYILFLSNSNIMVYVTHN